MSEREFYQDMIRDLVDNCNDLYTLRMVYTQLCYSQGNQPTQANQQTQPNQQMMMPCAN